MTAPVRLHNTLTQHTDELRTMIPGKVSLYTCGPTVYNYLHIGNWSAYIYWDVLVRTLRAAGYNVTRVMNITDVGHLTSDADEGEDKLEKGAKREGKSAWEVADFYTEDFLKGIRALGLVMPDHLAKATDYINEQLDLALTLKEKGYTYQTSDGIYFDTSKFATYADFAHLNLQALKAGARVGINREKRHASDFALWKFSPTDRKRDMEWETPDALLDLPGEESVMGFPGWHLECSAIAMHFLGSTLDIHTGGIDHIPVHHTNEIAQSEAATGETFSHYWLHCNHLKSNGTKISKSLDNGYTLEQLADRGYTPMDYKMFVLQGQYSNEGNFTWENLGAAHNRLKKWRDIAALRHQTHDRLDDDSIKNDDPSSFVSLTATIGAMRECLFNNLNTPEALSTLDAAFDQVDHQPLTKIHHHGLVELITAVDELLGLNLLNSTPDIDDSAKRIILERQRAREGKNWQLSDQLRDQLLQQSIVVKDTTSGPIWTWQ